MTDAPDLVNSIVIPPPSVQTVIMKSLIKICAFGMGLAACAPLSIYSKPGVSVSRMQNDTTNCEVSALKDVPIANEIRQRPPVYITGPRVCSNGTCSYAPGYWISGGFYTVDTNLDLRGRVRDQCMAKKGYQPASIPRCSQAIQAQVKPAITKTLPKLTETSCVVVHKDGTWQIVTPVSSVVSE